MEVVDIHQYLSITFEIFPKVHKIIPCLGMRPKCLFHEGRLETPLNLYVLETVL